MSTKLIAGLRSLGKAALLLAVGGLYLQAGTPVDAYGALKVNGNHVCDKNGNPVTLRGMSLFWSQWSGSFWNASLVDNQASDFRANIIRCPVGIENGGYLENPDAQKAALRTVVNEAIAKGIYVIIDWHDHNATQHTQSAKDFFWDMAKEFGSKPNVIFEIYNEPTSQSWGDVKWYAEQVIGAIRGAGSSNLVIVGSPDWSQRVDSAAADRLSDGNTAYTLHFYAGSHGSWLRDRASAAMNSGIAIFVTEWGTCDASGNGNFNSAESWAWLDWMNRNNISSCNWSLFDKNETASALTPGASTTGPWADAQLTQSGKLARDFVRMNPTSYDGSDNGGNGSAELPAMVTLKAQANGKYVCADNWGKDALIANRASAGGWETFDTIKNADGSYSLKAHANGLFVCAENAGAGALIANRTAIGDWEKFWVVKNDNGSFSLKAKINGKFVCADNAGSSSLIANRDAASGWEQFWVN